MTNWTLPFFSCLPIDRQCPPCRGFTPVLGEFYDIVKELDENALEIIFVSSDNEKSAFDEYYGSMPWISLPFGSSHGQALGQTFGVRGIPSLIVLKPDGSVVDRDGRSTVSGVKGNVEKALSQWGVN